MASSPPPDQRQLTPLQRDLLGAFFRRDRRMYLTGGAALAGFYLGHRRTDDLDLFAEPGLDLGEAASTLVDAARSCGATARPLRTHDEFRRFLVSRGDERCVVDLAIDHAPPAEREKVSFGDVRVDTLRDIAANKLCTLVGRSEIKDLVDVRLLLESGADLGRAVEDAMRKDGGADPGSVAWVLDQITIEPSARLPGDVDPDALLTFRDELVRKLRALAFERTSKP